MDRLVPIPERDSVSLKKKELTAISTDLFVSIPERDLNQASPNSLSALV